MRCKCLFRYLNSIRMEKLRSQKMAAICFLTNYLKQLNSPLRMSLLLRSCNSSWTRPQAYPLLILFGLRLETLPLSRNQLHLIILPKTILFLSDRSKRISSSELCPRTWASIAASSRLKGSTAKQISTLWSPIKASKRSIKVCFLSVH